MDNEAVKKSRIRYINALVFEALIDKKLAL